VEQPSTASSAHAVAKGASLKGDSIKEAKKSHDSNPSTNSSSTNNNNSSTYIYKDYANEEDITTKIINEYADRDGSGVQGSIISHEDETTKNLMQQKLPAKLAAMLSDPGEF
jgi:hypothetical protein